MSSNYENAPSTIMLATRCAVCRRKLRDAQSVEIGMGPDCRENHGYTEIEDASEEARVAANRLIHQAACSLHDADAVALCCASLRLMGFRKVADRIEYRGKDAPVAGDVTVTEHELPALPAVWRRGRWLPAKPARPGYVVVCPYKPAAVAAFRMIPGRRWDGENKRTFIPAESREQLWALLRTYYAGMTITTSKGTTTIPAVR